MYQRLEMEVILTEEEVVRTSGNGWSDENVDDGGWT